jgi:hypothetical protein
MLLDWFVRAADFPRDGGAGRTDSERSLEEANMLLKLLAVVAVLSVTAAVLAADKPSADDVKKAEKTVQDRLAELKGANARVEALSEDFLQRALPGQIIFFALFRQYPIAKRPPEGLKAQNLFFVGADGKLTVVSDVKGLEDYCVASAASAKDESAAKDVALAWLCLVEQFHQDGFYKFKTIDEATKVSPDGAGRKAAARAVVMAGGNGEINVEVTLDEAGKLVKATEMSTLKPGPRPICQATKLLDPDPLVRRICEADLLIMGRAAKDYLDEQRAKASPELQQAIDRLWQRIVEAEK